MEEQDIINLWKAQNVKIEQTLAINKQLLKEVVTQKARSAVSTFNRSKGWGIISFVIYLVILGNILAYAIRHYSPGLNYFIVSFAAIILINIKGLSDYIKHLVWVNAINYEGSITDIQEKLTKVQLSVVKHVRVMFLQLPFWTTFYLSSNWFPRDMGWGYLVFQALLTGSFAYAAWWLYTNQTIANLDKRWFRKLIAGSGGASIMQALIVYKEIEEFKQEGVL